MHKLRVVPTQAVLHAQDRQQVPPRPGARGQDSAEALQCHHHPQVPTYSTAAWRRGKRKRESEERERERRESERERREREKKERKRQRERERGESERERVREERVRER